MQLGCPKCHERQAVAASLLASGEARVRCTACGTWFEVRVRGAIAKPPPVPGDDAPAGRWYIRRRDETVIQFPSIRALYDYVVQGVVTIDDEISRGGRRWRPLRDVPELNGLFDAAEAAAVQVEVIPPTPVVVVPVLSAPTPAVPGVATPRPAPPAPIVPAPALTTRPVTSAAPPVAPSAGQAPAQRILHASTQDDDAELIVMAEPVPEDELSPPSPRPAPAPRPGPPAAAQPPGPSSDRWLLRELDDLGGAEADEDERISSPGRGGAWFWGLVAVVILGGSVYAAWYSGLFRGAGGVEVSVGETLPPNEPASTGGGSPVGAAAGMGEEPGADAGARDAGDSPLDAQPLAASPVDAGSDGQVAAAEHGDAAADTAADTAGRSDEVVAADHPGAPAPAHPKGGGATGAATHGGSGTKAAPSEPTGVGYDALMKRGNELLQTSPSAAIASFQRAMDLSPSAEPVAKIGWAYLNQGRPNEAIHWFEKALSRSTRYASTYEGLGRALERAGRRSDAIHYYELYLENFPVGSQATRVRALLDRLRGGN